MRRNFTMAGSNIAGFAWYQATCYRVKHLENTALSQPESASEEIVHKRPREPLPCR